MSENEEIVTYIKRAFELKKQECFKQSIEMLYKALSIEPDNIEILYQLGELYFLLHNYTRASQYAEKILTQDSTHLEALKLLKNIYLRQNELISAKEIALKIYDIEKNTENLVSIIKIYSQLNLIEELVPYAEQIEKDDRCLYEYANAYYSNKQLDKAEEIITKALKINPENESCKILTGKILFDQNKLEEAKIVFEGFNTNSQNPEILNYQGLFKMEEMNFIEAIKDFSKASNLDKNNPTYLYNLANAYFLNGWHEEAVSTYKKAIYLVPNNLDYRYSLAYLYYKYKEYDKAQREIDFILENDGKYYAARVIKALLLYQNKNYLAAEQCLLSNIKDGQDDNYTLASLAKIEAELGKFDKAYEHIKLVTDRDKDNLEHKSDLADILIKEKKYDEAQNIAKEIINTNPSYIYGYILGAKAAYNNHNFDITKEFAQDAISVDINNSEGYYYLALVRVEEKDYDEAIECMKRAITYDVTNAKYYAEMAKIYKLNGDIKTAFDYVKEAESINPAEEYKLLYKEYASLNRK